MKSAALTLTLLAALAGCGGARETAPPAPAPAAWSLAVDGDEAALTYGETVRLACSRGAGRIRVAWRLEKSLGVRKENNSWVDERGIGAPWLGRMQLLSGNTGADMRAEANPPVSGTGTDVQSSVSTGAPVMPFFRATGRISLTGWGETLNPNPANPDDVGSFLIFCG